MDAINNGITIKKADNDIYFSVSGDSRRYFDLESIGIHHPDVKEYIVANHLELERKMMQFRESYKNRTPFACNSSQ